MQRSLLETGQIVNVIDTPGLFDPSVGSEVIGKEIVKCIDLAKDGIHALLIVFSLRNHFSEEEVAALESLRNIFGEKIADYPVIVFTGGDEVEEALEKYFDGCSESLRKFIIQCQGRAVVFDNKTKDKTKKAKQVQQLLSLVGDVIKRNGGRPYTDKFFNQIKEGSLMLLKEEEESLKGHSEKEIQEMKEQVRRSYEKLLKGVTEMVDSKLREALAAEQATRLQVERVALEAEAKSDAEICELRNSLERALKETEELRNRCSIL